MSTNASHPREEEAIAFSFGVMDESERLAFAEAMKTDSDLRDLVHELQQTAAAITFDAPQELAPPDVRSAVLTSIQTMPQTRNTTPARRTGTSGIIGWAAAAALAILGIYGWSTAQTELAASQAKVKLVEEGTANTLAAIQAQVRKREEAAAASLAASQAKVKQLEEAAATSRALEQSLKLELARLTKSHEIAKVQIANLKSTVAEYQQGVAVVVWNSEKQEGILKLEKMPPVAIDKDYQLWVVDPSKKTPVNAGIVKVDANGFAKVEFKPTVDVQQADKFALSVEKKGGVLENEGPIILLSE